jgi:hypothetical protein
VLRKNLIPLQLAAAVAAGAASCQADTQFKNAHTPQALAVSKATTGYPRATQSEGDSTHNGGIQIPCDGGNATVAGTRTLSIPVVCSQEAPAPSAGYFDLDVVFVMDTTGSMKKYVELVRRNLIHIENTATQNGYKARVAALSFGDSIFEVLPLSENTAELAARMQDSNPLWTPQEDRGGSASEIGLGALEKGIDIVLAGTGKSKLLVFFTDGPSKRLATDRDGLASSFAVGDTAEKLRLALKKVQDNGGFFRFASGTSCLRGDSWFSEWPTPCEQISTLAAAAGVSHTVLPFGDGSALPDPDFLARVKNKPDIITVDCVLTSLQITDAKGKTLVPETSLSVRGDGFWSVPVEAELSAGNHTITTKRSCAGKVVAQTNGIPISEK